MSDEAFREAAGGFRSGFAPLMDELYRERVMRARESSPEEKFLAGEELESWCHRHGTLALMEDIRRSLPEI